MLLHTDHLTKDYGRHRALDSLTLRIAPGEPFFWFRPPVTPPVRPLP